jgi:hypothetical protein
VCIWLSSRLIVKSLRITEPAAPYLSTLGALGYAFTPLVWEYSTTAEVFALNNCLCAALLLLTCRTVAHLTASAAGAAVAAVQDTPEASQRSGSTNAILRLAAAGGLLCGLALSNQHASLLLVSFVAPTILAVTFLYAPALLSSVLLCAAAGFLAGFATYLYLPWAAAQPTPGSWGELASIAGLFRHVIREEYGTFRLGMIVGSETWWERIWIYLKHTSEESQHFVFPILLLGLIAVALLPSVGKEASTEPPATPSVPIQQAPTIFKGKVKSRGANQNHPVLSQRLNSAPARTSRVDWTRALLALLVLAMWLFYVLLWHCVLSNLPLSAPMPFAVHSRFWMQPNILLYTLLCCAVDLVGRGAAAVVAEGRGSAGLRGAVRGATECAIVVVYISVTLHLRYDSMDKSTAGDVMYRYGSAVLSAVMPERAESADSQVPLQSLLLSHTDLDWNPVRYLQHCEGVGSEPRRYFQRSPLRAFAPQPSLPPTTLVTHLSFQLMPYPWFAQTQAPLYPHVAFADTNFAGVTTDRKSEGNAQLVLRFLTANNVHNQTYFAVPRRNLEKQYMPQDQQDVTALPVLQSTHGVFTGGIYLDMQSIQEAEIEANGAWRGAFTLIPWAPVYRVFGRLSLPQIQELHHHSLYQLRRLQTSFPAVDAHCMEKFIPGSWERATANVYYDAHYQLGVNLLTYAIELQGKIEMHTLPLLLDRYYVSALLLRQTLDAVQTFDTFSSSVADLSKNTALAWMRLHALMEIVTKYSKEIGKEVQKIKSLPADALSQVPFPVTGVPPESFSARTRYLLHLFVCRYVARRC